MCGIAGIIGLNNANHVDPAKLDQMTDILSHRGPDSRGTKVLGHIGLGHRRLSILDLSKAGHQPMTNNDNSIWIVFNGEIYNYKEYQKELKSKGYHFNSNTDTEVIIHAYQEWGIEGCLKRLNGMFAFALVDLNKQETYIVRDRLGIKPLYYSNTSKSILFGSELKAIIANQSADTSINLNTLSHYLSTFYTAAPNSIFKNIFALEPGHYLKIKEGQVRDYIYWDVELTNKHLDWTENQILEKFDFLFNQSVKHTLVSDVSVGHLLSSGVDSNAVLYHMKQHQDNIESFTVDTSIDSFSEGAVSADMAKYFNTKHHNYVITPEAVMDDFETIIWHQDQLSGNSACIGIHFVFKLLKEHNIKVGLLGSGPDEMFAGYETYLADRYALKVRSPIFKPFLKAIEFGLGYKKASYEFVSTDYKMRKFLEGLHFSPEKSHYWWRSILVDNEKKSLFKKDIHQQVEMDAFFEYEKHFNKFSFNNFSLLDRSLYADLKMFLCNNSLMLTDGASMAHSVEARPSMLNHEFVEWAFTLPHHMKISSDKTLKYIMRRSMQGRLPQKFLNMPKRGMNLPISFWIDNEMKDFVRGILTKENTNKIGLFEHREIESLLDAHSSKKSNNMYKLWNLICFYKWYELMVEKKGFN
jgi:asparagine synthase (glutamine-hydrolysing)